ncbi:hypothetical protein [Promineifilum sp.]|uniref:hypothetical protein n=1 Tax=Promineifilum sp. TaxID=2664178 RepID=UPI0035B20F4C
MTSNKLFGTLSILLIALLAACSPTAPEPGAGETAATATPETPATDSPADAITTAVKAHLVSELGVAESDIEVVSAEATEFTDSCLGLGGPAESCLQAITPGWLVMVNVAGQEYEVHTDETGQQVRIAVETPEDDGAADAAVGAAQEFLAGELGVALGDVQIVSVEPAEFSDGCLGLGRPDESCLQAITPGWLIMVDVAGQSYEVHTDETGQQVRVAE